MEHHIGGTWSHSTAIDIYLICILITDLLSYILRRPEISPGHHIPTNTLQFLVLPYSHGLYFAFFPMDSRGGNFVYST